MEMGFSRGLTESDTPSDSVLGLKFGKKIYFEDTLPPPPPPPPPPASNSRSLRRKSGQGCQVEGCKVDLSHSKTYYSKHRVCPLHSKTSMVIVSGIHQRFCQQCSRFHQLPEFDQGKRSCRRRLAGHNERRRKLPCRSFSPRYGGVPTIFDNSNSAGGFLVDFSAYARSSTRVPGYQTAAAAKFTPQVWQSNLQDPPPNLYLQGLAVGTDLAGSSSIPSGECSTGITIPESSCALSLLSNQPWGSRNGASCLGVNNLISSSIPSGECFTGITIPESSCALSLLSNQPWGSRNGASCLGVNNLLDVNDAPLAQPSTAGHGTITNQYANPWSFKCNEVTSSPHQIRPDLGLGQMSHPFIGQHSGESELSLHNKRQYMEVEHHRDYHSSTQNMHWSP